MKIKVRAVANVYGMVRGQEYVVEASDTIDALLDKGFLLWIDEPSVPEPVLTEVVKKRAPQKKVEEWTDEPVPSVGMVPVDESLDVWGDDGGAGSEPEAPTQES